MVQLGQGMHNPHFPAISAFHWFRQLFCLESHSGFDGAISAKNEEMEWLKSRLRCASGESTLPRASPPGMPSEGETEVNLPTH